MGYKTVPNVLESIWMLSKLGVFWVRIGTQNLNYKEIGIIKREDTVVCALNEYFCVFFFDLTYHFNYSIL